ncbi:MAG: hypothetical protein HYV04_03670, partial [Deltaproteobacteria bacterium]|nr:hypothetical protein [Deltaproteobacteria bacterium]
MKREILFGGLPELTGSNKRANQIPRRGKDMGKEVTVISLLLLSLMGASKFAYGAPSSYLLGDTAWLIDGNVKATLDSPNLVKLSTTLPKLATFATLGVPEIFVFHGDGTFEGTATWTQSGN